MEPTAEALLSTAEAIGLPRAEAKAAWRSAYRKGSQKPRGPSERQAAFVPEVPSYPADADVEVLRRCSGSVLLDPDCEAYLRSRGIDPEEVSRRALARAIKPDSEAPPSVPRQRGIAATERGYRLMVEMVDGFAVPRSCVLRPVVGGGGKSLALKGARKRLVCANAAARALLTEKKKPEIWGDEPLDVYIVEGEIDFLFCATEPTSRMRAVFGIASGSWSTRFAVSIPTDAPVVIATDDDDAGEKLAQDVLATLNGHPVGRWRPHIPGEDFTDAGGTRGGEITWT